MHLATPRGLVPAALAGALLALAPAPAGAADGSLTLLHDATRVRGLGEPRGVAISPGGGNVYVTSTRANAIAVLRRDRPSGAVRQLPGRAGCLRDRGGRGCARARGLRGARAIALSADGRSVYVAGTEAIAVFRRNRRTGALRQLRGRAGCVSDRPVAGCARGRALARPSALALSPSGRFLYAISTWDEETPSVQGGVAALRRDPRTGRLVQLAGANGCVSARGLEGCARTSSMPTTGGSHLAIDRDGDRLYAGAGRVLVFDRRSGGVLRELPPPSGCVSHLGDGGCTPARAFESGPLGLVASPSGLDGVYASAFFFVFPGPGFHGAIANLVRDRQGGGLLQPAGPAGCISLGGAQGCGATHSELRGPAAMAVSRDGRNLYAVLTDELGGRGVMAFARNRATGELAQLPGPHITDLRASAIAVSPDGRNVYVTSGRGLAVYRRAR